MFEQESIHQQDQTTSEPGEETAPTSSEFLEAMRERTPILPIPDVGQKLHATITSIGEETAFLDYGGRSGGHDGDPSSAGA
jgi:hypothetical protein